MIEKRVIEMSGGVVALEGDVVLHGIDFLVGADEFVVLLGANGSGKTTLVRALLGSIPLTAGTVRLFGTPSRRFRGWSRIGYVPQRAGAVAGVPATVEEVVLAGRVARGRAVAPYGAEDRRSAERAIAAVGLEGFEKTSLAQLSGGQQQRVLIARALATEPDLLVLDEPVSAVDVEHRVTFAATLEELKRRGTSVLLVAHSLGEMAPLVERAVVLEAGRVAYDGPPLPEQVHVAHIDHHAAGTPTGANVPGIGGDR